MGQEFYPEYEENQYYDQEYGPYKNNNDNNANSQCREKIIRM
jgi:hypothetical protein